MKNTRFSTSLRGDARKKIERIGYADIVVGIPAYFSDSSIAQVIETVEEGLEKYYGDYKAILFISEGGSTDDTREIAESVDIKNYNIEKIVSIYRGIPGKGSGLRAVFEASEFLKAKAVAVFDSDLKSIKPAWVKNILDPVFEGFDFVAPDYKRFKFDATITNTIAHNLTRSLYGYKIRQPIGGDFGLSPALIKHYIREDVWGTDVATFGIDIWMTTTAIVHGYKICQARLGSKIHERKDPIQDLTPMFRQVVGTIFTLMEQHEGYWKKVEGSRKVPTFGKYIGQGIEPFEMDIDELMDYFQIGFNNFGVVWENIIEYQDLRVIENLAKLDDKERFYLPVENWVRIVYRYANAFHSTPRQRIKLLDTMIPLYYARVASLVNRLKDKDAKESDRYFERQAKAFEDMKDYLVKIWG
jgi:glycosyltransferase involved in cell wall biosynthesis